MTGARSPQEDNPRRTNHGLVILKRAVNSIDNRLAVNSIDNRLIDRRTVTGKALAKWRADLIRDLGGDISTQQSALVGGNKMETGSAKLPEALTILEGSKDKI
jgi:hypothetical protein